MRHHGITRCCVSTTVFTPSFLTDERMVRLKIRIGDKPFLFFQTFDYPQPPIQSRIGAWLGRRRECQGFQNGH
jgi:hypothetical protein